MINILASITICCVVCHREPPDHFITLLPELQKRGIHLHVHATPAVITKFKNFDLQVETLELNDTSLSEIDIARNLTKKCSKVSILLTDLWNSFDISVEKAFREYNPHVKRLLYYDNPESYIPGGYFEIANTTMDVTEKILFSNNNLACNPINITKEKESDIPFHKRIGIGYYPTVRAEKIRKKRLEKKKTNYMRLKFFDEHQIQGKNKKILIYFGGNNNEYYDFASPAFQKFLADSIKQADLSHLAFVIHQHVAAKNSNHDWNLIKGWVEEIRNNPKAPSVVLSQWDFNEIQTIADPALYYQKSIAVQFALAGIPTIQIVHDTYEDILVKNKAIPSIVNISSFIETLIKRNWEISQNV